MVKSNFQDYTTCTRTLNQGIQILQLGKSLLEVTFLIFITLSWDTVPKFRVMSISLLKTPKSWFISWKKNKVKTRPKTRYFQPRKMISEIWSMTSNKLWTQSGTYKFLAITIQTFEMHSVVCCYNVSYLVTVV